MSRTLGLIALSSALLLACPGGEAEGDCSHREVLEGRLSGNVVLGEGCPDWLVTSSVTVPEGATLTLLPGVNLAFVDDTGLVIDGGTLDAAGTADKPIVLTGQNGSAGTWRGVHLARSSSTLNRLKHVEISFAGGARFPGMEAAAALAVGGTEGRPSRIEISDSTFHDSAGYGIALHHQAELPGFIRNAFQDNILGSVHAHPASVGGLVAGNRYGDGSAASAIHVQDGVLAQREAVFHDVGTPFIVGSIEANAGAVLVLEPGVELRVRAGKHLRISGGLLQAVGTAEKRITLRGVEPTLGFWTGVLLHDAGGANTLAFVTISDAGGAKDAWALEAASVALTDDAARLSMTDSVVTHGAGYGLYLDGNASLSAFERNDLGGNALGPASVQARGAHLLTRTNRYGDPASSAVRVDGSDSVNADVTWSKLDVPYLVTRDVQVEAHLTLEPGTTLHFDTNAALIVPATGRLTALGTPALGSRFLPREGGGAWKGLWLHTSMNDNRIEYASIIGGGAAASSWSSGNPAGLAVYQSKVNVSGTHFDGNAGYGIWVSTLSAATGCGTATFSNNGFAAMGGAPCP